MTADLFNHIALEQQKGTEKLLCSATAQSCARAALHSTRPRARAPLCTVVQQAHGGYVGDQPGEQQTHRAYQDMMLSTDGAPLIPAGGSVWRRLKSRISLRLAGVVICVIEPSSS